MPKGVYVRTRVAVMAGCHPDARHYGNGLCVRCYQQRFRRLHPEYVREHRPEYDPQRQRESRIKARFGITVDDYENMLATQQGACAICMGPPGGRWNRFAVDHCHRSGQVRGLLCLRCNRAIGLLDDRPELIDRAAAYVRRSLPQAGRWSKKS